MRINNKIIKGTDNKSIESSIRAFRKARWKQLAEKKMIPCLRRRRKSAGIIHYSKDPQSMIDAIDRSPEDL